MPYLTLWDKISQNLTYLEGHSNYENTPIQIYIENFTSKIWKFSDKIKTLIFFIYVQNIDCGYSLELPLRGSSNEYHYVFKQK